jgi:hypothetical protein
MCNMGDKRYVPAPLDTSTVDFPPALAALAEQLAQNVHEVWAAQRVADGWSYGPERDDTRKRHPGLVPYESLPEAEKDYDRRVSLETMKTILALGFRIVAPEKR